MKKFLVLAAAAAFSAVLASQTPASAATAPEGASDRLALSTTNGLPGGEIKTAHGWHGACRWRRGLGWHRHQGGYRYRCPRPYGGGGY